LRADRLVVFENSPTRRSFRTDLTLLKKVIHEVLHMVMNIPVTEEGKVAAIAEVIQSRTSILRRFSVISSCLSGYQE
jgi:hypothetical protein